MTEIYTLLFNFSLSQFEVDLSRFIFKLGQVTFHWYKVPSRSWVSCNGSGDSRRSIFNHASITASDMGWYTYRNNEWLFQDWTRSAQMHISNI